MQKLVSNRAGFGLMEVLVSLGILSIIMFISIDSVVTAMKASTNVERTNEATEIWQELNILLSNQDNCDKNFAVDQLVELPLNPTTDSRVEIDGLKRQNDAVVFDKNVAPVSTNHAYIKSMALSDIEPFSATTAYKANLSVMISKGNPKSYIGPELVRRKVGLIFATREESGKNRIISCMTAGQQPPSENPPGEGELSENVLTELVQDMDGFSTPDLKFRHLSEQLILKCETGAICSGTNDFKNGKPILSFSQAVKLLRDTGIDWNNVDEHAAHSMLGSWRHPYQMDCGDSLLSLPYHGTYISGRGNLTACLSGRISDRQNVNAADLSFIPNQTIRILVLDALRSNNPDLYKAGTNPY